MAAGSSPADRRITRLLDLLRGAGFVERDPHSSAYRLGLQFLSRRPGRAEHVLSRFCQPTSTRITAQPQTTCTASISQTMGVAGCATKRRRRIRLRYRIALLRTSTPSCHTSSSPILSFLRPVRRGYRHATTVAAQRRRLSTMPSPTQIETTRRKGFTFSGEKLPIRSASPYPSECPKQPVALR